MNIPTSSHTGQLCVGCMKSACQSVGRRRLHHSPQREQSRQHTCPAEPQATWRFYASEQMFSKSNQESPIWTKHTHKYIPCLAIAAKVSHLLQISLQQPQTCKLNYVKLLQQQLHFQITFSPVLTFKPWVKPKEPHDIVMLSGHLPLPWFFTH